MRCRRAPAVPLALLLLALPFAACGGGTFVRGTLVASTGAGRESEALSLWFDRVVPTPNYGEPVVDLDAEPGEVEILLQGAREDVAQPGSQPVDPDADPERIFTTDWTPLDDYDALDNYQYLRLRVVFRVSSSWTVGEPLPSVTRIEIPVSESPD